MHHQATTLEYHSAMKRGHELRRVGRFAEAADSFRTAAEVVTADRDALLFQATCLKQAGQVEEARRAYEALIEAHPDFATGWSLYGVFLKNSGKYGEAIAPLRRALQIKDDFEVRNTLVVSLYKADQLGAAQTEGLRNLQTKDATAVKNFATSRYRDFRLPRPRRQFSPRTAQRNVISFSLWGDDPAYVHGAIVNARIAPHIYYGWTVRFYCDASVPSDAVEELRRAGAQVIHVSDSELQPFRPMWRFLVSDDPEVDWFICRDADSRLNCQELLAVDDWLRSGKRFHVMRDHLYHMELVLAGMWGAAAGVLPDIRDLLKRSRRYANNKFADQALLMNELWPLIRQDVCSHDTYYRFHGGTDFPAAYRLPRPVHVGGAIKQMPTWRR